MLITIDQDLFGEGHNNDLDGEGFKPLDNLDEVADDELFDLRFVVVLDQGERSLLVDESGISILGGSQVVQ